MEDAKRTFSEIYGRGRWSNGSGSGSAPATTIGYRRFLESFMASYSIKTVIDFGCGDWQFSRLVDWRNAEYLGIDAVEEVIKRNKQIFGSDKRKFTMRLNVAGLTGDLLIVKDVLQHWPNKDVCEFKRQLSGFSHVLITNTRSMTLDRSEDRNGCDAAINEDIFLGDMRPIDLSQAPFFWPVYDVFTFNTRRERIAATDKKVTCLLNPKENVAS
jgi:hypothetical protein